MPQDKKYPTKFIQKVRGSAEYVRKLREVRASRAEFERQRVAKVQGPEDEGIQEELKRRRKFTADDSQIRWP